MFINRGLVGELFTLGMRVRVGVVAQSLIFGVYLVNSLILIF